MTPTERGSRAQPAADVLVILGELARVRDGLRRARWPHATTGTRS